MADPIVVHTEIIDAETDERRLTVESFPKETELDFFLLGAHRQLGVLQVDDPVVTLTFANGQATYRLALSEISMSSTAIPAYLISSRLSETDRG